MTEKTKNNVELLIEFYKTKGRWPYSTECYKEINIGSLARNIFYDRIKLNDYYHNMLSKMEFFTSILHKKVLLLLEFLNTNERYPYSDEFYRDFNIYKFANAIKKGKLDNKLSNNDKKAIKENIYFNSTYKQFTYHKKTLLLIEFYDIYGRWPKITESFKDEKVGEFSTAAKRHRIPLLDVDKKLLEGKEFPFK